MQLELSQEGSVGFIGALVESTLDMPLTHLSISKDGKDIATGLGCISSGSSKELKLEAYITLCPGVASRGAFKRPTKPGQATIPTDDFYSVTAQGANGTVTMKFASATLGGQQTGRIVVEPIALTVTHRGFPEPDFVSVEALVSPLTGLSDALLEPGGFEYREGPDKERPSYISQRRCWWSVEVDGITYLLSKISPRATRLSVWARGRPVEQIVTAMWRWKTALALVSGHSVEVFGFRTLSAEAQVTRHLRTPGLERPAMAAPLPFFDQEESWKQLVLKYMQYSQDHSDSPLLGHLEACWTTKGNYTVVHDLAVATAIERLAEYIHRAIPTPERPELTEFASLKMWAVEVLEREYQGADLRSLQRLKSILGSSENVSIAIKLEEVAEFLDIDLSKQEITAWKEVRNSLAHGRHPNDPYPNQSKRYLACLNIFYKLILAHLGYQGPRNIYYPLEKLRTIEPLHRARLEPS